jgi:hypothetical protein
MSVSLDIANMKVLASSTMKCEHSTPISLARTGQFSINVEMICDTNESRNLTLTIHAEVLVRTKEMEGWIKIESKSDNNKTNSSPQFKIKGHENARVIHCNTAGASVIEVQPTTSQSTVQIQADIKKSNLKLVSEKTCSRNPIFRLCFTVLDNGVPLMQEVPPFVFAQIGRGKTDIANVEVTRDLQSFWKINTSEESYEIQDKLNEIGQTKIIQKRAFSEVSYELPEYEQEIKRTRVSQDSLSNDSFDSVATLVENLFEMDQTGNSNAFLF